MSHIKNIVIIHVVMILLFFSHNSAACESIRVLIAGNQEITLEKNNTAVPLNFNDSLLISLDGDTRFIRGIEIELTAPQQWLSYRGSLAMALYANLDKIPQQGIADMQARRLAFEPLPAKIQMVYHIPIRRNHGLRSTPYVTVPADTTLPDSFPMLFRIMPVIKGLSPELEAMVFQCIARPILSDEGAVRLIPRYPGQMQGKPFTVLINDTVIPNIEEEVLLKEGEHHLVVLSDDYRNETRRFVVERTKTLDINIELQDPTPLVVFEAPQTARIFLNNVPVSRDRDFIPVEPGIHEARIQVGDYTVTKTLAVQRGKTYRVVMAVDINVRESD